MGTSGETCVVACKVHVAGIVLHLDTPVERLEGSPIGQTRRVTELRKDPTKGEVRINGTAYPIGIIENEGFRDKPQMAYGYALTPNVDREWFETWLNGPADHPEWGHKNDAMVLNHMLFAGKTIEAVRARAKEFQALRSGLEPMLPMGDPRVPRPVRGVTDIAPVGGVPSGE